MKKILSVIGAAALLVVSLFFLQGCIKDSCKKTYTYSYFEPVYKTTAEVKANIKSNAPTAIVNPGKLYVYGNYIFLNEIDKGIHIIDNSNPAKPNNVAFIDMPGNVDLAVKDNTLYADFYTDLVVMDISNPVQATVKKFVEGVFPYRFYTNGFYNDTTKVIVNWIKHDTTVVEDCNFSYAVLALNNPNVYFDASSSTFKASAPTGIGGSMARFAITHDRLYTVGNSEMTIFNIAAAANPSFVAKKNIGWDIETIYPFKDKLFLGSSSGMFVYSIDNADNPFQSGQFSHVRTCDPVIADNDYAYVTLRSGTACAGFTNQLEVLQLNDNFDPTLLKIYPMTNPHGLSKDGTTLFVCDGSDGLKIYNAANVNDLQLIKQINGFETEDVIAHNHIALVVAKDGFYQYDYTDINNIKLLSKLSITNN